MSDYYLSHASETSNLAAPTPRRMVTRLTLPHLQGTPPSVWPRGVIDRICRKPASRLETSALFEPRQHLRYGFRDRGHVIFLVPQLTFSPCLFRFRTCKSEPPLHPFEILNFEDIVFGSARIRVWKGIVRKVPPRAPGSVLVRLPLQKRRLCDALLPKAIVIPPTHTLPSPPRSTRCGNKEASAERRVKRN